MFLYLFFVDVVVVVVLLKVYCDNALPHRTNFTSARQVTEWPGRQNKTIKKKRKNYAGMQMKDEFIYLINSLIHLFIRFFLKMSECRQVRAQLHTGPVCIATVSRSVDCSRYTHSISSSHRSNWMTGNTTYTHTHRDRDWEVKMTAAAKLRCVSLQGDGPAAGGRRPAPGYVTSPVARTSWRSTPAARPSFRAKLRFHSRRRMMAHKSETAAGLFAGIYTKHTPRLADDDDDDDEDANANNVC